MKSQFFCFACRREIRPDEKMNIDALSYVEGFYFHQKCQVEYNPRISFIYREQGVCPACESRCITSGKCFFLNNPDDDFLLGNLIKK